MKVKSGHGTGNIGAAIAAANRSVITALMTGVAAHGFDDLTPAFAAVIPRLDATGMRSTALAQQSGVTKQAASQLVRELLSRGYVEQVPDPTDTRAKIVRLTKRGVALRTACVEAAGTLQARAAGILGEAALARLERDLVRLAAALG